MVASRILSSADPVTKTVCAGNGLIVSASGILLDLNDKAIRGSGVGVGVRVEADSVTVQDGRVNKFSTGIWIVPGIQNATIEGVEAYHHSGDGILIEGDYNTLIASPARHNGNNGVTARGDHNSFSSGNNEYNGAHGFFIQGDFNQLTANQASENETHVPGNGITLTGNNNRLQGNRMTKFNRNGIVVTGNSNTLIGNHATKQRDDGIIVQGDNNVLTNNKGTKNDGLGILVTGNGTAAASSGNFSTHGDCTIYDVTGQGICDEK